MVAQTLPNKNTLELWKMSNIVGIRVGMQLGWVRIKNLLA